MPLKSYTTLPPAGWVYLQKETGWKLKNMGPFNSAVKEVVEHRRLNNLPRATMQEAAVDLENATCQRIGNNPQFCADAGAQKKTMMSSGGQSDANPAGQASLLQSVVSGTGVIKDWLGPDEVHVSDQLAQARANVCINECSDPTRQAANHFHNRPASFFGKITGAVAKAILEQRREKLNLGLKVDGEDKLNTCDVCRCHLPLKVWTKMEVILNRTDPMVLPLFPDFCWMKTENRRKNASLSTTAEKTTEE